MSDEQVEAFQELIAGIYIQQLRIYDLLAVLVSERMPEKMEQLERMHTDGKVLSPEPALRIDED
jgi:hypothetical protein